MTIRNEKLMTKAGFALVDTGGGGKAWERKLSDDGTHAWITDSSGMDVGDGPQFVATRMTWLVGLRDNDGNEINSAEVVGLAAAIATVKSWE